MDRDTCRAARTILDQMDFSVIERTLNVKVKIGKAVFDPSPSGGATFKVEFVPIVNGTAKDKTVLDFERQAIVFGLEASDLGRTFIDHGIQYRVMGLVPRSYKFPILCKNLINGKTFKFSASTVKFALGR